MFRYLSVILLPLVACGELDTEPDRVRETEEKPDVTPGETEVLPVDSAPVPGTLEHVCTGTEQYYYEWPVEPQQFAGPPRYGAWAIGWLVGSDPETAELMNNWSVQSMEQDGIYRSWCKCSEERCDPERYVLVPLAW